MRVPSVWTTDKGTKYQYLVVDCCHQPTAALFNRELVYRAIADTEGNEASACAKVPSTWALLSCVQDTDKALEHWSPMYPENDRQFQKALREIVPSQPARAADKDDEKIAGKVAKKSGAASKGGKDDKVQIVVEDENSSKDEKKTDGEDQVEIVDDEDSEEAEEQGQQRGQAPCRGSSSAPAQRRPTHLYRMGTVVCRKSMNLTACERLAK